ncbi:MAG: 2-phospho-L-lactate transferase [Deltaproteobacteria bacterium]|nr:2-phospho-L-lactate transferase [Deltaproteobacteria bacterium]MBW1874951.1 2-phospho-L-lactate transferase [Deltaproteobacteria bacterium]MBW2209613.1 2-phospho-L-lactate transferase [Deltaproteobacteria bacterium]MBW2213252.1 2-phospho-L-lactate transferase [Deltaproteobacteria bacterium]MBW2378333.1 2-phospho-L-lactate transferase [Deltaproteobacteria bacterium]
MTAHSQNNLSIVALAGGVGGARLVDGLDRSLPPGSLTVVVNTGDDFRRWGLHISPDLDTVMYTLAGLSPEDRGWGIDGDTFHVLAEARRRGVDEWFQLGDRDLVTHLSRTGSLSQGDSLTRVTANLCKTLGVVRPILPMTDAPRPTSIVTQAGEEFVFQEWLVKARAAPAVKEVRRQGTDEPSPAVLDALDTADLVVICPSNPYVSIDPILTLKGVTDAVRNTRTVAVSPILGGQAVKGPLATMIPEISGYAPSAKAVAMHYEGLLDGYAVHPGDAFDAPFPILETNTLIQSKEDRVRFARELIEFARSL